MPTDAPAPSARPGDGSTGPDFHPRPFRPSPWLPGPHFQTLGGKLFRPSEMPPLERIRIETPDDDFLDLDLGPEPGTEAEGETEAGSALRHERQVGASPSSAPLVLVLHGLEGSSRRSYALLSYRALLDQGMRPVGMNFRGCSGEPNRTLRFYHSGATDDVVHVLEELVRRFPGRPVGAIGFSLGGNMLLKHLGEAGEGETPVGAAVTVSVPFDLAAGADRLEEDAWGRLYSYYFLRNLRRKLRLKEALVTGHVDVAEALAAPTIRSFDERATAPLHGFEGAADYYERSSSARFLEAVRTPTLLLQSRDDPFLPENALPMGAIRGNPWLTPAITDRGGHVGFVEGPPWAPRFWAEEEAARFLRLHLAAGS